MAHPRAVRGVVKAAYVYKRMSMKRAAAEAGVSYRTAANWKEQAAKSGDDWDKARDAATLAGEGAEAAAHRVLVDHLRLHQEAMDKLRATGSENISPMQLSEISSRLTDSFLKASSAYEKAVHAASGPELSRQVAPEEPAAPPPERDALANMLAILREAYGL